MRYDYIEKRDRLIAQKLLRCDNLDDLRIYSYTDQCKTWDDITLNSRGIIYDRKTGKVIAQPFPKFFNMNQRRETQERNLPWKDGFRIFRKEDGWLGILFRRAGQHKIATRGSFHSIGANWATKYLQRYDLTGLPDEVTLLFEIICPITSIVVNYGDREDLVLLAAYNRYTGKEYDWKQIEKWSQQFGFTLVESYDKNWLGFCRGQIKTVSGAELEGFVIRFNNGLRVKIKSEDYFRRSNLLMNLTPLGIWAMMVDGKVPDDIWQQIDIDYHDRLDRISTALTRRYQEIYLEIQQQLTRIDNQLSRTAFAKIANKVSHRAALFALFDGLYDRVDRYIMQQIRPHNNVIDS